MTSTQVGVAVAGVLLVCWIVGAYNRMVSLRNVLAERFAAIDALCRSRHALIERQVELLATALAGARPRLDALHAASRQADAARAHAQARPALASRCARRSSTDCARLRQRVRSKESQSSNSALADGLMSRNSP